MCWGELLLDAAKWSLPFDSVLVSASLPPLPLTIYLLSPFPTTSVHTILPRCLYIATPPYCCVRMTRSFLFSSKSARAPIDSPIDLGEESTMNDFITEIKLKV